MDLGISGKKLEGRQKIKTSSNNNNITTRRTNSKPFLSNSRVSTFNSNNNKKACQKSKSKVKTIAAKQEKKKKEEETKILKTKHEEMNEILSKDSDPSISGTVKIRFNHYNKSFQVKNGIVKWKDIDDEYAISFVYHGEYTREIYYYPSNLLEEKTYDNRIYCERDEKSEFFYIAAEDDTTTTTTTTNSSREYQLYLEEDSEAGVGIEGLTNRHGSGKLDLTSNNHNANANAITSGNTQTEILTKQLKQMNIKDLSSQEAKDMIERRDLEDILYS